METNWLDTCHTTKYAQNVAYIYYIILLQKCCVSKLNQKSILIPECLLHNIIIN